MYSANGHDSPIVKSLLWASVIPNFDANETELGPMSIKHAVTMSLIHIKTAYLMNSFTIPYNSIAAMLQAVKMTVDWMFQQGQGDLQQSMLILVSTHISAHLIYLAICLVKFHT